MMELAVCRPYLFLMAHRLLRNLEADGWERSDFPSFVNHVSATTLMSTWYLTIYKKGPPTFTCAVKMVSKTECRVHHRLDATVDALLAGKSPLFEICQMNPEPKSSEKSTLIPHKQDKSKPDMAEKSCAELIYEDNDTEYAPHPKIRSKIILGTNIREHVFVYTYKIYYYTSLKTQRGACSSEMQVYSAAECSGKCDGSSPST